MYIEISDLLSVMSERSLIELSNDESRATQRNDTVIQDCIASSCERIDASLRSRFKLPLKEIPTVLKEIALYLTRYKLYTRRPEGGSFPEVVTETYKEALKQLNAIQSGQLHLGLVGQLEDDLVKNELAFKTRGAQKIDLQGY